MAKFEVFSSRKIDFPHWENFCGKKNYSGWKETLQRLKLTASFI